MVLQPHPSRTEGYAVLVNLDKCVGCRACQVACKDWNSRRAAQSSFSPTFTNPKDLTSESWKVVFFYEGKTRKALLTPAGEVAFEQVDITPLPFQCMHCVDPPCARACPVGAIKVTKEGVVVISRDECIGCGFCETACPFRVPRRGADGKYYKCTFCVDRIQSGLQPACVEVCPAGVFTFGAAKDIVEQAKAAVSQGMAVYGLDMDGYTGGGVRWIYVSSERKSFAIKEHFADRGKPVATQQVREVLKPLIVYGSALGALALGVIAAATWRKMRAEEKASEGEEGEKKGQ
jgi:formate dehydrogenase iron-sulfur subunit